MIELTAQQMQVLEDLADTPAQMVNPRTGEIFVLLSLKEYDLLLEGNEYDDSPLTKQELQTVAWEAGKSGGWQGMDEYDND